MKKWFSKELIIRILNKAGTAREVISHITKAPRRYPVLPEAGRKPTRPISFIVVHFSDEFLFNFMRSECVRAPINQVITIDNRRNLFFGNLTQALNQGIEQAQHELIAVVEEDVWLPDGWQARLEANLALLESEDPNWGMVGSVGWDKNGIVGHYSDPRRFKNTLHDRPFAPVELLDEQIMLLRKSSRVRFDAMMPSIHNIGRDLSMVLKSTGRATYVVNAPTVHKYSDAEGRRILTKDDSHKIRTRKTLQYLSDKACSDDYLFHKWPSLMPQAGARCALKEYPSSSDDAVTPPVILLVSTATNSRRITDIITQAGVKLPGELDTKGDSIAMATAVYKGVLNSHQPRVKWQQQQIIAELRAAAQALPKESLEENWGFKLPEACLLLPELDAAFPNARYVHFFQQRLTDDIDAPPFDHPVGRLEVAIACRHFDIDLEAGTCFSPAEQLELVSRLQLEFAQRFGRLVRARFFAFELKGHLQDEMAAALNLRRWLLLNN